jgi:hypothetical protein
MYMDEFKEKKYLKKGRRSLSIIRPNKGTEIYQKMRESYLSNIKKYRDTSNARAAIITCGEYKPESTKTTPKGSDCVHKHEALDELVSSIKNPQESKRQEIIIKPLPETYT